MGIRKSNMKMMFLSDVVAQIHNNKYIHVVFMMEQRGKLMNSNLVTLECLDKDHGLVNQLILSC